MARRSQCSSAGDNPLDPNYLPPHYREEYRLAVDALVEDSLKGYYQCLQNVDVVDFLSPSEIQYIQSVVQPPKQSILSEQQFLDSEGEGSSDTYWPIHSDLDVPGLDLGWPQIHHFIEPTEVTTLVNPPEPDMPSIKEQARRLIKNAQQVIAIVMDMFTDVDIFADILNAAGRRVAVYILLDEQNADLFVNMVANCRVNLQAFPFIRLRTVSGITYQCRSGKSFKGQMMDRFLLTDCRAVLSGNYSFMWSFEKLHRCMAHLFLGQLVTTFDEEFRILFAQSQPLNVEHMLAQMEDLKVLQQKQFPNESTSLYREPKRFISVDIPSDDWGGHLYDEPPDGNLRIMALNRQGSLRGPADVYNRFGSQQSRMDPSFDQGPSRHLMTDNPALKRHSYTEDVPGRYPFPLMPQQGMPDSETRGKPLHWGQQPFPGPGPGPEEDYSSYDKFWNQGYLPEQYPVPALQQEVPPEFDPVLNYLSSTRNLDVDQGIDKLQPPVDFSFTSPQPKRLGIGQPYACQTSPTPSNSADQKPFFHDLTLNRKDPTVKQKLRNWRIGSYLSTYDNPEEEGLPMVSTQPTDTFEEPLNPNQQTAQLPDLPASKIPNVKEFKVTTVPRVSQMPGFVKAVTQEKPKKFLDDPDPVVIETKTAPASSETSYTAEGRKTEEEDQKLPISTGLQRDDSFRRKYNPGGLRTSRLRSSLIFSSLEQQTPQETTTADQDDEEGDKTKTEQAKLPLVAQVLGQRRSTAREPFEWSRYIKSTLETLKPDDVSKKEKNKDASKGKNSQDLADNPEVKESIKPTDVEQDNISLSMPQVKLPELKAPKTDQPVQPTEPLLTDLDMSDPDKRLMFFKELAAKRKAAKAAEAQKEKEKAELKPQSELKNMSVCQKEESLPKGTPETSVENISNKDSNIPKTSTELQVQPKKTELDSQSLAGLSVSVETGDPPSKPLEDPTLPNPFVKESLSALIPQSKPTSVELPKTDQPVQLPNLLFTSPYIDMSDPDNRLMFFKELAAKRKASQAKKGEEEAQIKPQADLQNTSVSQKEEDPKGTTESMEPSVPKGSSEDSTTLFTETSNSESSPSLKSPSLKLDENTRKQDNLVRSDPSTLSTSGEQAQEVSIESVKTDLERRSAEETEASQSKSSENPTESELSVLKNSPKQGNVAHTAVSSHGEGADKGEPPTLEYISIIPSLGEGSSSPTPQNTESVQLETSICSPPLPSEAESTSEIDSVQVSTSDTPPLDSGLHNRLATTEQTSFSDSAQEVYSSTDISTTTSSNIDEIKAQESVSSSQQEPSNENVQTSDQTHLNAVSQSASSEDTSDADAAITEPVISPDKKTADLEPDKLNATTETNGTKSFAGTPLVDGLEKNVTELGQEESVAEECEALKSPEDVKAQSTSPAVSPSVPDSTLPSESGPEGSVSEPDLEKTVSSVTVPVDNQPADVPTETGSLESTESPKASLLEKSELPQEVAIQTAPSSNLKITDLATLSVPKTLSSSSTSESDQSGLDPEDKVSVTSVSTEQNLSDTNSISNDSQPKSEESFDQPTAQSLSSPSEPTTVAPADADFPCKISEAVTPQNQTPEPAAPQESSKKEAELGETDEKKSNDLEDKDKSQKPSTEDPASREKTKDQSKQSICSETTEVTSKQPKSSQSRYHSSTVNVITSSNLRDDTKLLLEKISAQSQSRNEATKESPVTDDEKEDNADKKARNEKELGYRTYNRGQTKSTQEKEKLLERIQSMRKERKVYSRFEMAP